MLSDLVCLRCGLVKINMSQKIFDLEFIERMYRTFDDAPQPKVEEITLHRCIECDDIRDSFKSYSARNVPDSKVEWLASSLCFLSPIAFRHYLPRCIEFSIQNSSTSSYDNIVGFLASQNSTDSYWKERVNQFSKKEKVIVAEYLDFLRVQYDYDVEQDELAAAIKVWDAL